MFTDIVGYTALMGQDEDKAVELLKQNRELHKPFIERFNGRKIKEIGDGVLICFSTATDAVLCAGHIQQSSNTKPQLRLRIGIHVGDIIVDNDDIFGDGVNIAARLQTQAKEGGICISEMVRSNVSNKKGITATFMKEELLKNVKDPVKMYEVEIDFSLLYDDKTEEPPQKATAGKQEPGKASNKSIAVLPFVNMSKDPDQEYFSDGITEEILNSLSHVKALRVAGRTSSFYFKGKNIDLRDIGKQLNVHTILEGSVRKQGQKLRVTAQLINVDDGYHLWSEKYDREMEDIFAIQDEIAFAITEELKITLLEDEKASITKVPTNNKEAYDLYLKGRFYFNKRGTGIIKGLEYLQLALDKDPELSLAYTGIADAYCILALYSIIPAHHAMPKARLYANKAIALSSSLSEAYTALAFISTFYDWNWEEAKKCFKRVFEYNPNYSSAYYWHSYYLSFVERKYDEAIAQAKKAAEELEPLVHISHHILSIMYMNAGRFEEGIRASKTALELDGNSYPGYRGLGLNLAGHKKYDEAIEAFHMAVNISGRQPLPLVELSWVYSLAEDTAAIQAIMDELLVRSNTEYISATFLSCLSYYLKNYDQAVTYMEQAYEQRECTLACINTYPLSTFIRTDSRFQHIIKRFNFPE
jgi:TolB-like protein